MMLPELFLSRPVRWLAWCGLALVLLFASAIFLLRYVVMPSIGDYRQEIEQAVSKTVGIRVSIGAIAPDWLGVSPGVSLDEVTLYGKDGAPALVLPHVVANVSWKSLLVMDLRLQRLVLDRPDLSVERDASGQLLVAGLAVGEQSDDARAMTWLLKQREIRIENGRLHWRDGLRQAPDLSLDNMHLVMHNRGRRHQLSLQATPPATLSAPLDIRADFKHPLVAKDITDVSRWDGTLYLDVSNTELGGWKDYIDYPVDMRQGKGAVRAWMDVSQGRIASVVADVNLSDVDMRFSQELQPLQLVSVEGRISARETNTGSWLNVLWEFGQTGHEISMHDFRLETRDGLKLNAREMAETFEPATKRYPERFSFKTSALDLKTAFVLAERLPLPASQRQLIHDLAPSGHLRDFQLQWEGSYPQVSSYRVRGQFDGLSLNALPATGALPAMPGVTNLSGKIDSTQRSGDIAIDSVDTTIVAPEYLSHRTMAFQQLQMQTHWSLIDKDTSVRMEIERMHFVQEGARGNVSGNYTVALDGSSIGRVDLRASLDQADLRYIGRYLPSETPEDLKHWLGNAISKGRAKNARLVLRGELAKFPFNDGSGEFSFQLDYDDMVMNYQPGYFHTDGKHPEWPLLEQASGQVTMQGARLEISADKAMTHGVPLSGVKAVIADVLADDASLVIDGTAQGDMRKMLDYLRFSPVEAMTSHFLSHATATGQGKLHLWFDMPFADTNATQVRGTVNLMGNDVDLLPDVPTIRQATGAVSFSEKGFDLANIRGKFLGGNVAVSGGMPDHGNVLVNIAGQMTAQGLQEAWGQQSVEASHLIGRVAGQARYTAQVRSEGGYMQLDVDSDLRGMAIDLPAPLGKLADVSEPFKLTVRDKASHDALLASDEWGVSLGHLLSVRYQREKIIGSGNPWHVKSGGIGINEPAPQPESGITLRARVPALNLDEWGMVSDRMHAAAASGEGRVGTMAGYMPDTLELTTPHLYLMDRRLNDVLLSAHRKADAWQADITSEQVAGQVNWREGSSASETGQVQARLSRLYIPATDKARLVSLWEKDRERQVNIPELDIVADDFWIHGKSFGKLELNATSEWTNVGQEWRIGKLVLTAPDSVTRAAGSWIKAGKNSTSNLTYAINISNAGKMLDRLGFVGVVRGGSGLLDGAVNWRGAPTEMDLATLEGDVQVRVGKGQFLKADPGVAKLLGVLSLQSLPRRLTFDFSDLFSQGFGFDNLEGSAHIENGLAQTKDMMIKGVAADVLMSGSANIVDETQNLRVIVMPNINVGAAAVVAMTVNPAVGIGSMIAQFFMQKPLKESLSYGYEVTGSWDEPVVNRLGDVKEQQ